MFKRADRATHLRRIRLFADCTEAELDAIGRLSTPVRLATGHVLLREGDCDRQFMVVVDGRIGVSRDRGEPVAVLSPGDFVGELALLAGGRRSATVTALTPVEVLVCTGPEFGALVEAAPSVRDKIEAVAASRMAANAGEAEAA